MLHILVYFSFGFCIVLRVKTLSVVGGYARLLEFGLDWRRRIYSIFDCQTEIFVCLWKYCMLLLATASFF